MIDTSFLSQLDRFSLIVYKRVTSNYIGSRKSMSLGRGLVFKENRMYAPGDDIRAIDWKVYARTDNLYVKTYEEERNLTVHIVVDHSASMDFGKPIIKFDYASMLGVGFAYLTMKNNEKCQFSTFSDDLKVFQPKKGMSQLVTMIDYLNSMKTQGQSKIKDSMQQYKKFIGSKSMLVLISDFLMPTKEIDEALYFLGGNEVKVIQVLDNVEKDLNLQGDFKLKDSETGARMHTYVSPRLRIEHNQMMEEHTMKIEKTCNELGFRFYSITTNTPIFDAFYQILR